MHARVSQIQACVHHRQCQHHKYINVNVRESYQSGAPAAEWLLLQLRKLNKTQKLHQLRRQKGLIPRWDTSQYNQCLLSRKWRPDDILNEKIDDHLFEHDNDQVAIAPTLWSSSAPKYPAHLLYCSLQLPPNPIEMQTPTQSTKGACVRCSPTPSNHLSTLTPTRLSPPVWLMCSICWMMDWAGQGKSSHTFPVLMAGRQVWPCWVSQGPPPMAHCWPYSVHYNLSHHLRAATPLLS